MTYSPQDQLLTLADVATPEDGADLVLATIDPTTGKLYPGQLPDGVGGGGGSGLTIVEHGTNANLVRPATNGQPVWWIGSVQPNTALDGDFWGNTSGSTTTPGPVAPTTPAAMPAGFTHRWEAAQLTQADDTAAPTVPNLVSGGPGLVPTGGVRFRSTSTGLRYFEFDGVDDRMDANFTAVDQPFTKIVLARFITVASSKVIIGSTGASNIATTSTGRLSMTNGTTLANPTYSVNDGYHVYAAVSNGSTSSLYVDAEVTTGAAGPNAQATIRLAANASLATFANLAVCAVLFYPRVVSDSELATIAAAWKQTYPGALA